MKQGNHLAPFILATEAKPGTCSECAVKHAPEQPHNKDSMFYQYKFYNEHGRWPTWTDAMAHCSVKVQDVWKNELKILGVSIT